MKNKNTTIRNPKGAGRKRKFKGEVKGIKITVPVAHEAEYREVVRGLDKQLIKQGA